MRRNEEVKSNEIGSPMLFLGLGGRGSDIIKGVAERCWNDSLDNVRFVVMDTDVNDISHMQQGVRIEAIQTSTPRTVGDYLKNDKYAAEVTFPDNKMLKPKVMTEGAGQVRAISDLAINATIKSGKIRVLYDAIDDLYLKDGKKFAQGVKIVIATTAAGGTGSGSVVRIALLIRHYFAKKYPDSSVLIRGFLVLPSVMDTFGPTQSEKESLARNGYATIKEINAFMMKSSGFFDADPELYRYQDLHIESPTAASGNERLSGLPFDFCFLMDKTDALSCNMKTMDDYIAYAAQTIYEQNIGPMQSKTTSKEDNVLKELTDLKKRGRSRFGGAGASVIRYPINEIVEYVAYDQLSKLILGYSSKTDLSDEEKEKILRNSWLQYDVKFNGELQEFKKDINANVADEPKLADKYCEYIESSKDSDMGNRFSYSIWKTYVEPKLNAIDESDGRNNAGTIANEYFSCLRDSAFEKTVEFFGKRDELERAEAEATRGGFGRRFNYIKALEELGKDGEFDEFATAFIKSVFNSNNPVEKQGLGAYSLERFLSVNGVALHPNVARYFLYALKNEIKSVPNPMSEDSFKKVLADIKEGKKEDGKTTDKGKFQLKLKFGKNLNLKEMCDSLDELEENSIVCQLNDSTYSFCQEELNRYYANVTDFMKGKISRLICDLAVSPLNYLIKSYEDFYNSLGRKTPFIQKRKDDIFKKIEEKRGTSIVNLFDKRELLDKLSSKIDVAGANVDKTRELYSKIFMAVRQNSYTAKIREVDPFTRDTSIDIFDEVLLDVYKDMVEDVGKEFLDVDVLRAIKHEFDVDCDIRIERAKDGSEEKLNAEVRRSKDKVICQQYIKDKIDKGLRLACPSIMKNDFEEPREISSIAYSESVVDGDGINVEDFLSGQVRSACVSKYELRFFRAVYNIMPIQISAFSCPQDLSEGQTFIDQNEQNTDYSAGGFYFEAYQKYMEKVAPDSSRSAIITPHVDKRWNSISVMPELDISYQKWLMKNIHKAMVYGFLYGRIYQMKPSDYSDAKVYRYLTIYNDEERLIVSNRTTCDKLYEVLDALYFDRMAVKSLHEYVAKIRKDDTEAGKEWELYTPDDRKTTFEKGLRSLDRKKIDESLESGKTSILELPLMYYNSLPSSKKDNAEIKYMVEAVIEVIEKEITAFTKPDGSNVVPLLSTLLQEHYDLLIKNIDDGKCGFVAGVGFTEMLNIMRRVLQTAMENRHAEITFK